jgi:hypothetical protein
MDDIRSLQTHVGNNSGSANMDTKTFHSGQYQAGI